MWFYRGFLVWAIDSLNKTGIRGSVKRDPIRWGNARRPYCIRQGVHGSDVILSWTGRNLDFWRFLVCDGKDFRDFTVEHDQRGQEEDGISGVCLHSSCSGLRVWGDHSVILPRHSVRIRVLWLYSIVQHTVPCQRIAKPLPPKAETAMEDLERLRHIRRAETPLAQR